jgi:hypothetical protein
VKTVTQEDDSGSGPVLARYLDRRFDVSLLEGLPWPPPDEPFVEIWDRWAEEARTRGSGGAWGVLARNLPQLAFPVREGMRGDDDYRRATLQGADPAGLAAATGLAVPAPESIGLEVHPTPAGRLPVITVRHRPTFELLVQALTRRNEPVPVAPAHGASMVAGYNDWRRIDEHRRRWAETPEADRETATWAEEFARIRPLKDLYQDRFLLLSDGPYSAVPAADLGLDDDTWRELSLVLRREHEATHYFTRRLLGSMENHLLDELLADWSGLVAATGGFRADWFLRFLGLEDYPRVRPGGRLALYLGDVEPGTPEHDELLGYVVRAARRLERRPDVTLRELVGMSLGELGRG